MMASNDDPNIQIADDLYDKGDALVGKMPGTLMVSGSARDLRLVEDVLQALKVRKTKDNTHRAVRDALDAVSQQKWRQRA